MPVVLIHGNSCSKDVFSAQLESAAGDAYRMIAFDLPGHGESSDPTDPQRTYSMNGLADMTMEVLQALGVDRAVVYGWSLGGHIALELVPRFPGLIGFMLTATPPVHPTPESLMGGYRPHPMVPLIGQENLSDAELAMFAETVFGPAINDTLRAAVRRADGRARRMVLETAFDGRSSDQRAIAENAGVPIALVNGENDPIINVDYIGSLNYATLWEKHCFVLRGEGHAPFLTNPKLFNPIFERFLKDMAAVAQRPGAKVAKTAAA
ncbi:MAG: alpha/beta hydrolase [Bauldia sp.]|nr:alpha/beta hydrolase [Bauldia sp.]